MKTIGWIVTSSSRSGTRGIARRLRPVSSSRVAHELQRSECGARAVSGDCGHAAASWWLAERTRSCGR